MLRKYINVKIKKGKGQNLETCEGRKKGGNIKRKAYIKTEAAKPFTIEGRLK